MTKAFPGFASSRDRTEFLLAEHRLGELTGDDLTPLERRALLAELRRELRWVRRRAWTARLVAVGGTFVALALGYTLLGVGPTAHFERFQDFSIVTPLIEGPLWLLILGPTIGGLLAAEMALRRGLRVGTAWSREAALIRRTIARVEAAGSAPEA